MLSLKNLQRSLKQTVNGASQVASAVKNLSAQANAADMRIQRLGWEDPLEKGMATHSSILAWKMLWTEEPDGLQSIVLQRAGRD